MSCRQQEKEPEKMRKELAGVMRQISSSVSFLPLLADLCEWGAVVTGAGTEVGQIAAVVAGVL
jgi:hypothetical protein